MWKELTGKCRLLSKSFAVVMSLAHEGRFKNETSTAKAKAL